MFIAIVLALAVGGGIFLIIFGFNQTLQETSAVEDRLDSLMGRGAAATTTAVAQSGSSASSQAVATAVEKALSNKGYTAQVQDSLARADLKWTVGEFMVLRLVTTVVGALLGYLAGITNSLVVGVPLPFLIAGAFIGYKAPSIWVGRRASKRLSAFNSQLGDTISLLANGLRSGNSAAQAMALAAREAPPPTNQEFARVVAEMTLGIPPEEAFANLVKRMPSTDLDMMVTAMNVSAEVGGNLAQVLEKIGETIRQRMALKGDIATLTAQQQGAGYVVSAMPAIIGFVMFLLNGKYIKPMFDGFPYLCMPICAALMIFAGFIAMKGITNIEV